MKPVTILLAFLIVSCQQPTSRYVVSEGHATIQAPIESMTLSIAIQTRNPSLEQANKTTRDVVLKMFQTFKKFNIPDSSFVTLTDESSSRREPYEKEKFSEIAYSGDLRGVDPRIYDRLFADLLSLGDVSIRISSFQNSQLDQYNKRAYEQAVANARKQAELMLSGTGARVGKILKVLKTKDNPFDEYDDFENHVDKVTGPKTHVQYDLSAPNLEPIFRRNSFDVSSSVTIMFEIE